MHMRSTIINNNNNNNNYSQRPVDKLPRSQSLAIGLMYCGNLEARI